MGVEPVMPVMVKTGRLDVRKKQLIDDLAADGVPCPSTIEFDDLLHRLAAVGVPFVGVGRRWGPRYPQLEQPGVDAPVLDDLDRAMVDAHRRRHYFAQEWFDVITSATPGTVTVANRQEVARRRVLFEGQRPSWQAARNPASCLQASAAHHMGLFTEEEIGRMLTLKGDPGSIKSRHRFHQVEPIVVRGEGYWRALGAWPWVTFPDVLPMWWWEDDRASAVLHAALTATEAREW